MMIVLILISFGLVLTIFFSYPNGYIRSFINDNTIADYVAVTAFGGIIFLFLGILFGNSKKIDLTEIEIWTTITFFGCLGYYISTSADIETPEIKDLFHMVSIMLIGIAYLFVIGRLMYLSFTMSSDNTILNQASDDTVN